MNREQALGCLVKNLDEWPNLNLRLNNSIDKVTGWFWCRIQTSDGVYLRDPDLICKNITKVDWQEAREAIKPDQPAFEQNPNYKQKDGGDSGAHYRYEYKGIKLDPYRILDVYGITSAPHQHAIKKLLRAGDSMKSKEEDIKEVIDTLNRWLDMLSEDNEAIK